MAIRRIGPDLVFARLWKESGISDVLHSLLKDREYEFDVERAIYLTVLHRLFASGSDRAAERWREDYLIPGTEGLELHHLYRAMAFLGEAIEQLEKPTGAVRCTKDLIEEALFESRRDLFTEVELVFFDTTSLYFEGQGGESSANAVTIRITDPISSRWSSAWPSMWRVARFAVRCGRATRPT